MPTKYPNHCYFYEQRRFKKIENGMWVGNKDPPLSYLFFELNEKNLSNSTSSSSGACRNYLNIKDLK